MPELYSKYVGLAGKWATPLHTTSDTTNRMCSIPKIACLSQVDWQQLSILYVVIKITPLCLAPWIDIRDYSTFSDKVKVSRFRGEGT